MVHAAFVTLACGTLSHGDTTRFAINLSGQSVGDDAFLDYVLAEIEATGIAPERIFFEITETAAVGNLAKAMHFIRVLKELGFRFVLDDFGSGLSSFAYLKNLQVDFLKIDGGFVRDMMGNSVQRALVESIHQIGKVMGIRTIAESVEDRPTLDVLRRSASTTPRGTACPPRAFDLATLQAVGGKFSSGGTAFRSGRRGAPHGDLARRAFCS